MNKRILVVAAHPDDEVLGCGGTIARHIADGDEVDVVFLTDGVGSRGKPDLGSTDASARNAASLSALEILGIPGNNAHFFSFPDNALDSLPRLEIVKAVESIARKVSPNIVYTHHPGDLNIDHRYAYEATLTAFRPQPGSTVEQIYSFEIPSSTGWLGNSSENHFHPSYFVGIEPYFEKKKAALIAYDEEMRNFPHARSMDAIEALAVFRGSHVGLAMAEAFVVERRIRT